MSSFHAVRTLSGLHTKADGVLAPDTRKEHLAREVAMEAFLAEYAYAVEAITGKLPAEGKDGEVA